MCPEYTQTDRQTDRRKAMHKSPLCIFSWLTGRFLDSLFTRNNKSIWNGLVQNPIFIAGFTPECPYGQQWLPPRNYTGPEPAVYLSFEDLDCINGPTLTGGSVAGMVKNNF